MDLIRIQQLEKTIENSQNFLHVFGTTQTNTNNLGSIGNDLTRQDLQGNEVVVKNIEKTTRGAHCVEVATLAKTIIYDLFADELANKLKNEVGPCCEYDEFFKISSYYISKLDYISDQNNNIKTENKKSEDVIQILNNIPSEKKTKIETICNDFSTENAKKMIKLATLASIVGKSHDIGHCLYGHDGEDALNKVASAQLLDDDAWKEIGGNKDKNTAKTLIHKDEVDSFRKNYYNSDNINNGSNYETQQNEQNYITGLYDSSNAFIFDHGEQSAEAFINICEANNIDINDQDIQEIVQGILFHSRPAFETKSFVIQAVQVSDALAFIQDDFDQMEAFDKTTLDDAKTLARSYGVSEDTINMSKDARKEWVRQEIVRNFRKTGKIQTGQHIQDQKWYIQKLIDRFKYKNLSLTEEQIKEIDRILKKFGIDGIDISKLKSKDAAIKHLESIKDQLENKLRTEFPRYWQCVKLHDAVTDKLIRGEMIGNNQHEDSAYAQFIMSRFINEYKDQLKDNKYVNKDINSNQGIYQTLDIIYKTNAFIKLKEAMEKAIKEPDNKKTDELFLGMKTLENFKKNGVTTLKNTDVLKCIGFNFDSNGNPTGILKNCSPVQIIQKICEGLTNEFSRFYEHELVKSTPLIAEMVDFSVEHTKKDENWKDQPIAIEDINDGNRTEVQAIAVSNIKDRNVKFSVKSLLYLGYNKKQIEDVYNGLSEKPKDKSGNVRKFYSTVVNENGILEDSIFKVHAKDLLKEKIIQKYTLRHENPGFDAYEIIRNAIIGNNKDDTKLKAEADNFIKSIETEIINELGADEHHRSSQIAELEVDLNNSEKVNDSDFSKNVEKVKDSLKKDEYITKGLALITIQELDTKGKIDISSLKTMNDIKSKLITLKHMVRQNKMQIKRIQALIEKFARLENAYYRFKINQTEFAPKQDTPNSNEPTKSADSQDMQSGEHSEQIPKFITAQLNDHYYNNSYQQPGAY